MQRWDSSKLEAFCGRAPKKWRSHKAITTLRPPEGYGTDSATEPFALTVMTATARALAFDDDQAANALWALLDRWAKGDALTRFEGDATTARYSIQRTMFPVIVALSILEAMQPESLNADDQRLEAHRRIVDWIGQVVDDLRQARQDETQSALTYRNNHALLYASVIAAWGGHTGQRPLLDEAIDIWEATMATMRPDGSLPLETQRGSRALWYQRHALASMIAIAQIADQQGVSLYEREIEGRTIHDAVEFLVRALNDPSIVEPYAAANVNPGPFKDHRIQDLGFMRPRGHGRHYMAWAEIYRARFPERKESQQLEHLLHLFSNDVRPMVDEYSGGNMTCLFAR